MAEATGERLQKQLLYVALRPKAVSFSEPYAQVTCASGRSVNDVHNQRKVQPVFLLEASSDNTSCKP